MSQIGTWTYTFVDGTTADADEVMANLNQAKTAINTIDLAQMNTNSVGTDQIVALAVTTAKLAADAITGAKVADDAIDSEHYVDGSIDTQHIADAQITATKLGTMFEGAQDTEVASDTVTETDWHDIVGSSVSVTLDVASDVMCLGFSTASESASGGCYLRVVYATNGSVTQVGQYVYVEGPGAGAYTNLTCGGIASNLAADTYTFKVQAKVGSGTGTYKCTNISVLSVPHR